MRGWLTALLLCAALHPALGTPLSVSQWTHAAAITVPGSPQHDVIAVALSPQVFDVAAPDLSDVRITTAQGEEVPYVITEQRGTTEMAELKPRIYNRASSAGRQSSATLDFGSQVMKNRIEIDTNGTDFTRRVTIDASDDGRRWLTVGQGTLYRVVDENGSLFDKRTVMFPENNQRYLRLTIFNDPGNTRTISITHLHVFHEVTSPAQTEPIRTADHGFSTVLADGMTQIEADFGYRNLPITSLRLDIANPNFYRRVSVYGRNARQRTIREPLEGGSVRTVTIEEDWTPIRDDVIARYGDNEPVVLDLGEAKYRYLRVNIRNGNDAPLDVTGISGTRLRVTLTFPPVSGDTYRLYAGNAAAAPPSYDLGHYVDRLRREGIATGTLGPMLPNPAFKQPGPPMQPWSERHQALLWGILLLVFLVLLILIIRQINATKSTAEPAHES